MSREITGEAAQNVRTVVDARRVLKKDIAHAILRFEYETGFTPATITITMAEITSTALDLPTYTLSEIDVTVVL